MQKKFRGSTSGLQAHYRDKEKATQDALVRAYQHLKDNKPDVLWTKADLWKTAELKSGMALKNPVHSNVLALFERHNADVRGGLKRGAIDVSERKTSKELVRDLRQQIAVLTVQRDKAASLNAIYQRESLHYQQQAEDLETLNRRLVAERDEWREKFFAANKPHIA